MPTSELQGSPHRAPLDTPTTSELCCCSTGCLHHHSTLPMTPPPTLRGWQTWYLPVSSFWQDSAVTMLTPAIITFHITSALPQIQVSTNAGWVKWYIKPLLNASFSGLFQVHVIFPFSITKWQNNNKNHHCSRWGESRTIITERSWQKVDDWWICRQKW